MKTLTPFEIMVAQSEVINDGLKKAILARPVEQLPKREAIIAFAGQDLGTVKRYLEGIMSSWNGEDSRFSHEGEAFHEDDVSAAEEIIEKIDELQEMFNNFTN